MNTILFFSGAGCGALVLIVIMLCIPALGRKSAIQREIDDEDAAARRHGQAINLSNAHHNEIVALWRERNRLYAENAEATKLVAVAAGLIADAIKEAK